METNAVYAVTLCTLFQVVSRSHELGGSLGQSSIGCFQDQSVLAECSGLQL